MGVQTCPRPPTWQSWSLGARAGEVPPGMAAGRRSGSERQANRLPAGRACFLPGSRSRSQGPPQPPPLPRAGQFLFPPPPGAGPGPGSAGRWPSPAPPGAEPSAAGQAAPGLGQILPSPCSKRTTGTSPAPAPAPGSERGSWPASSPSREGRAATPTPAPPQAAHSQAAG